MKKSRIKFIKELHEESDEAWKEAIEKEFPKIFKEEGFKVGEWWAGVDSIFRIVDFKQGATLNQNFALKTEGINKRGWYREHGFEHGTHDIRKATAEETKKALIKEAERRGFKAGVHVRGIHDRRESVFSRILEYYPSNDHLNFVGSYDEVRTIYVKGQWVLEIVPTMTKEEAEEKLNVKII